MFTAYSFNVRKQGTTFEHYKTYLETTHAPLLMRLLANLGPWSYTRSYTPTDGEGAVFQITGDTNPWPYDCVTRLDFADAATFHKFSDAFRANGAEIAEDEAKFMDREKTRFMVVGESSVSEVKE